MSETPESKPQSKIGVGHWLAGVSFIGAIIVGIIGLVYGVAGVPNGLTAAALSFGLLANAALRR